MHRPNNYKMNLLHTDICKQKKYKNMKLVHQEVNNNEVEIVEAIQIKKKSKYKFNE